jgi:hypothetical protein
MNHQHSIIRRMTPARYGLMMGLRPFEVRLQILAGRLRLRWFSSGPVVVLDGGDASSQTRARTGPRELPVGVISDTVGSFERTKPRVTSSGPHRISSNVVGNRLSDAQRIRDRDTHTLREVGLRVSTE